MNILWSAIKEILPEDTQITTDTEYGCYTNLNKWLVPGKFDNTTVRRLSIEGEGFYVRLEMNKNTTTLK